MIYTVANKIIKAKYNFGKKIQARLHFRHTLNNLFLTLTDLNDKVIYTRSTGVCLDVKNKRERFSVLAVEYMAEDIAVKIKQLKIKEIEILVRSKWRKYLQAMLTQFMHYRIAISKLIDLRMFPHNGVRARKQRRN